MMADNAWLNVETDEQRERYLWTKNLTVARLGFAKHADVNIVMSRKYGARQCDNCWSWSDTDVYARTWIKNNSDVISSTYAHFLF